MKDEVRSIDVQEAEAWVGWCCSYCAAPLELHAHGLFCRAEGRFFATLGGVHRLLPEERRRELRPVVELQQRERRDAVRATPEGRPLQALTPALLLAADRLRPGPWDVLEAGGGCAWAVPRLLADGHRVAAVGVNLDAQSGLGAVASAPAGPAVPRAEAEAEALPIEPQRFDLVVASGSLHQGGRPSRTLVELRRVTRRSGHLLVLDSPVFRRREDGEAAVARAMKEQQKRYGVSAPRESQPGYLVLDELPTLFARAGWSVEVHGWPEWLREWAADARDRLRAGRRGPRFPIVLARRDG